MTNTITIIEAIIESLIQLIQFNTVNSIWDEAKYAQNRFTYRYKQLYHYIEMKQLKLSNYGYIH